jgi:Bacterial Ig-like domain (group 2)
MNSSTALTRGLVIPAIVSLVSLAGCGGRTSSAVTGVAITPTGAIVVPGGVQQFTATVTPSGANQAVTWSVTGCTEAECGTIDPNGKYAAPATVANPPLNLEVTATSVADSRTFSSAAVTLAVGASANNARLSGQYAFLFSGSGAAGPVGFVGAFVADGNGNLVAGSMDVTWGTTVYGRTLPNGTYSVGSDNHGAMSLSSAIVPGPELFFTLSFALDSFTPAGLATSGRLIASTGSGMSGSGFLVRQDPSAFSIAAFNGGYAFGLTGPQGFYETVALGRFTASGGSLSAGHVDLIGFSASGLQPDQPFTGTYLVDGSGRGEAALNITGQPNPLNFILYVVSPGESLWMDASGSAMTGTALQQSGGPFNASSLSGTAVFGAGGGGMVGNDVAVGEVQFDGRGNLSGTNDENYFGLWFGDEPITGTYTVDSNGLGRGVINETQGPGLGDFYLVSPGRGFIVSGNDALEFGTFEPQTGSAFSNASLSGNYALGTIPWLSGPGTSHTSGVLAADGVGNFSATVATKAGIQSLAGTYSVTANGRATLSISPTSGSPSNLVFYFVSASKAVGVQTMDFGPANAAVNVIEK